MTSWQTSQLLDLIRANGPENVRVVGTTVKGHVLFDLTDYPGFSTDPPAARARTRRFALGEHHTHWITGLDLEPRPIDPESLADVPEGLLDLLWPCIKDAMQPV